MAKSCCQEEGHIASEHHDEKFTKKEHGNGEKTGRRIGTYIMLALVAVLLVFALVQTVQINNIGDKLGSGSVSLVSAAGSSTPSAAQAARASPAPAPTMVGGC